VSTASIRPSLDVFFLDVGQGDASLLLLPDDSAVIFDCADDNVLRKTLDAWSVRHIAAFIVSHFDADHIGGALQFLRGWPHPIESVYIARDRPIEGRSGGTQGARELVDHVAGGSWDLHPNTRASIRSGDGWSVDLLAPRWAAHLERDRSGDEGDPNQWSAILRIVVGEHVVLIGADAPLCSWSALDVSERRAAVFRIPHHGGALDDGGIPDGWDVARLYQETGAATAVISVGTHNRHGHPRPEWIGPLAGGACRLMCTQVTSRCHPPLHREAPAHEERIREEREAVFTPRYAHLVEAQWRHLTDRTGQVRKGQLELPCAGTVAVRLGFDETIRILPSADAHDILIDRWQQPLCRAPER
jgi:beta-lactamase superfamily II metal-dependent hydrolase